MLAKSRIERPSYCLCHTPVATGGAGQAAQTAMFATRWGSLATIVRGLSLVGVLLLLSTLAPPADAADEHCLVEDKIGDIVGKIAPGSIFNSGRNVVIEGYKVTLLKPRCFDYIDNSDKPGRIDISEVQMFGGPGLAANVGKKVKLTGRLVSEPLNTIAWPQIYVDTYEFCDIGKKSNRC